MKFLIVCLVLLMLGIGNLERAIASRSQFVSFFENLQAADDNEKNYRFPAALDTLGSLAAKIPASHISQHMPATWGYQFSADSTVLFIAGVLMFNLEPNRLIYGIIKPGCSDTRPFVFSKGISDRSRSIERPSMKSSSFSHDGIHFTSLEILLDGNSFITIPDVEVKIMFEQLVQQGDDNQNVAISQQIWERLTVLLSKPDLFDNPFNGFPRLATLVSPDGVLKISTWNIINSDGQHSFHGGIAVRRENIIRVFQLTDEYRSIRSPEQASLSASRWFGSVYYDLVQVRHKGQTYYTLLGFNGNNPFSKIRVVEALTINSNGTPRFSSPIFFNGERTSKRLVFEYSFRASMMLRYNANERMIVMDNLSPSDPSLTGDYRFYGPDFSHNGLRFENGKWVLHNDIDLRNPPPPRVRQR